MVSHEFAKGDKALGVIIGPKFYSFNQFIGSAFGIPLKKYDPTIAGKLLGISTFERADGKKLKAAEIDPQLSDILEQCDTIGINTLLVVSADYFKRLTGQKGFEDAIGYTYPCTVKDYEHFTILPCVNPAVLNAQPNKKPLVDRAIKVCGEYISGTYTKPVAHEFKSYELVTDPERALEVLGELSKKELLACDIETTGLRVGEAEVLTIAFAWDEYNAVTFALHHKYDVGTNMIKYLKQFFESYSGSLMWHNSLFDLKQLVYNYYMDDFSDLEGIYKGCEALGVGRCHDTMLMAFCGLNSTDRPQVGLKVLAKEFLGDWAEDMSDNTNAELEPLAFYNAKDVCGTFWVFKQYKEWKDSRPYVEIMQPSIEPLLHMMLNGIPIDLARVEKASEIISGELNKAVATLHKDPYVAETVAIMNEVACRKYNESHKKQKEVHEFDLEFNPNSPLQLRTLLYDVMGFEPVGLTKTGAPSTDRASLEECKSILPDDDDRNSTLDALKAISETAIIQNTFITAFLEMAIADTIGNCTLHGNLRLGGTQSGRLSSSEPNLKISLKY